MLDLQLHPAGGVDFDQVDKFPWNDAGPEVHGELCQGIPGHRAFEQPAYGAAQSDGNFSHSQSFAASLQKPLQVYVVHAHHFSAVDVDDLPIEDVLLQEKQVLITSKGLKEGILAQFQ